MHRIFPLTWSFRAQLGVLTLATAVVSVLGTWLIGCPYSCPLRSPSLARRIARNGRPGLQLIVVSHAAGNRQVLNRRAH